MLQGPAASVGRWGGWGGAVGRSWAGCRHHRWKPGGLQNDSAVEAMATAVSNIAKPGALEGRTNEDGKARTKKERKWYVDGGRLPPFTILGRLVTSLCSRITGTDLTDRNE
jgi:hypothetical protein